MTFFLVGIAETFFFGVFLVRILTLLSFTKVATFKHRLGNSHPGKFFRSVPVFSRIRVRNNSGNPSISNEVEIIPPNYVFILVTQKKYIILVHLDDVT